MSECVVRMPNPDDCNKCAVRFICSPYEDYWQQDTRRKPTPGQKGCRILSVLPENHGRLVDADALINQWATVPDKLAAGAGENKWVADMVMGIQGHFLEGIIKSLEDAPTIVPAERIAE